MRYFEVLNESKSPAAAEAILKRVGKQLYDRAESDDSCPDRFVPIDESPKGKAVLQHIMDADPTPKGIYVNWIVREYLKGNISRYEDLASRVIDVLTVYNDMKSKLPPEQKDIMRLTWEEVQTLVEENAGIDTRSNTKKDRDEADKLIHTGQARIVEDNSSYKVISLHDVEAAKYFGRGTRWCTAAENNNMFNSYHKDDDLLYVVFDKKNKTKMQFHFGTGQYMDVKDEPLPTYVVKSVLRGVPALMKVAEGNQNVSMSLLDVTEELYLSRVSDYHVFLKTLSFDPVGLAQHSKFFPEEKYRDYWGEGLAVPFVKFVYNATRHNDESISIIETFAKKMLDGAFENSNHNKIIANIMGAGLCNITNGDVSNIVQYYTNKSIETVGIEEFTHIFHNAMSVVNQDQFATGSSLDRVMVEKATIGFVRNKEGDLVTGFTEGFFLQYLEKQPELTATLDEVVEVIKNSYGKNLRNLNTFGFLRLFDMDKVEPVDVAKMIDLGGKDNMSQMIQMPFEYPEAYRKVLAFFKSNKRLPYNVPSDTTSVALSYPFKNLFNSFELSVRYWGNEGEEIKYLTKKYPEYSSVAEYFTFAIPRCAYGTSVKKIDGFPLFKMHSSEEEAVASFKSGKSKDLVKALFNKVNKASGVCNAKVLNGRITKSKDNMYVVHRQTSNSPSYTVEYKIVSKHDNFEDAFEQLTKL